jgi:hypothetical protein
MASTAPSIPRQELRDTDGRTFAFIVSAEEMDRMRAEIDELNRQVAALRAEAAESQRQLVVASGMKPLPPMTDDELRQLMAGPHTSLRDVIAELDGGSGDGVR